MTDTVVIEGEVSLVNQVEGEVELNNRIDGDPNVLIVEGGGSHYPHYQGDYTVTPSTTAQVLDTDGKVMDDDVTVQAVQQGSATTPATIITANPAISVSSGGLITATVENKIQQITPTVQEGYVSTGTPGNVGVSGSNTEQLTVQSAQTIHPSTEDQTIDRFNFLTGVQTIKGVKISGLSADKILQGTTVKIGDEDDDDCIISVEGTVGHGAIEVEDTSEEHGGTLRTIMAVDVSETTATASDVLRGKYFIDAEGVLTEGTNTGGGSITEVTVETGGAVSQELQPNAVYHFTSTALTSLTVTFAGTDTDQYHFDFISPATAVTLTLPSSVSMESPFSVEANTRYEIDIYQGYGVFAEWAYGA